MRIKKFLLFGIFRVVIAEVLAGDLGEGGVDLEADDLVEGVQVGGGNIKKYKSRLFVLRESYL